MIIASHIAFPFDGKVIVDCGHDGMFDRVRQHMCQVPPN